MRSNSRKAPQSKSVDNGSATPATSENNRRARRKRLQGTKQNGDSEVGPPGVDASEEANQPGPSRQRTVAHDGFGEEDFIAFAVSDAEEEKENLCWNHANIYTCRGLLSFVLYKLTSTGVGQLVKGGCRKCCDSGLSL